jgi:hypothetical protein
MLRIRHVWYEWFDAFDEVLVIEVNDITNSILLDCHLIEDLLQIAVPIFEHNFICIFDVEKQNGFINSFPGNVERTHEDLIEITSFENTTVGREHELEAVVGEETVFVGDRQFGGQQTQEGLAVEDEVGGEELEFGRLLVVGGQLGDLVDVGAILPDLCADYLLLLDFVDVG